ncbi:MAG: hypothetical protein Q6373_010470 [Candidatus Sigynarchaeota archaeon]
MHVAFGKVSVTPADLSGLSLAGYYRKKRVQGVMDTLYARGILIEDTILGNVKKRVLLISIDTMKVPLKFTDYIKEKLFDAYKIAPGAVLIHAIHTHAGLDLTGEYHWPGNLGNTVRSIMFGTGRNDKLLVWMARQIVKMVGEMLQHMEPCKIAWARTVINGHVIHNRRHYTKPYVPDLGIICFKNLDTDAIIGVAVNFGAHPTILSNRNYLLSAEWPGRLVARIESCSGFKAVFFNDAAGDVSPSFAGLHTYIKKIRKARFAGKRVRFRISQAARENAIDEYGGMIGDIALDFARSIPASAYFDRIEAKCYTRLTWLPIDDFKGKYNPLVRIQNRFWHLSKKYFLLPIVFAITHDNEPNFPGLALKHRGLMNVQCYTKIQYFRFVATDTATGKTGSFNIIGIPGEPLRHFGRYIQRRTKEGFENSFMFQMSTDWMAYLFDYSEYTYGGGEPMESLTPVAGKYLKKHFIQLFEDIEEGLTAGHF